MQSSNQDRAGQLAGGLREGRRGLLSTSAGDYLPVPCLAVIAPRVLWIIVTCAPHISDSLDYDQYALRWAEGWASARAMGVPLPSGRRPT